MSFRVSETDLRLEAACSSALDDSRPFGSIKPLKRDSYSRFREKYG